MSRLRSVASSSVLDVSLGRGMQLTLVFLLCFAAGVAGGYVWSRQPAPLAPTIRAAPEPFAASSDPVRIAKAPLIATQEEPAEVGKDRLADVEGQPSRAPLNVTRPAGEPPVELAALAQERAKADELAAAEPLDVGNGRVLLEQLLAGKLPHEPSPRDYDRLAEAFLRARAAERVLSGIDDTPAGAPVREEYSEALSETVAEVERITGLKIPEVKKLVDARGNLGAQEDEENLEEQPAR